MNYLTILLVVLLLLSLVEFSFAKHKALCNQLFHITFLFTVFWVSIKYYIGPDIASYVPFYEGIPSIKEILNSGYAGDFEIGFAIFCSLLKSFGFSFWGMTVVITLIYFGTIYKVFQQISSYRIFALFILMILDYNLSLYEFRQCLAVSFYLWMVMFLFKKKYVASIILLIIVSFAHKSGLLIAAGTYLIYGLKSIKIDKQAYILLFILFVLFLIIPLKDLVLPIVESLPLNASVISSIKHHLLVSKSFQWIFILYAITIFCTAYYGSFSKENAKWHWIIFVCLLIIVLLFQYWLILNRIRSYFLPLVIVYIFNTIKNSKNKSILPKQLLVLSIILFSINLTRGYHKGLKDSVSKVNDTSTVFKLLTKSKEQIKKEQMEKAIKFWKYDYLKNELNK